MSTGPFRLTLLYLACLALMSFKMEAVNSDDDRLIYDVRSAFVTSRSDIPAELMQRVHHHISEAIQKVTHSRIHTRVILAIRIAPIDQSEMLIGHKAGSAINVRATAVATGEVVAEARFRATALGWTKTSALEKLGDGIAQQIINEFRLTPDERSNIVSALAPNYPR